MYQYRAKILRVVDGDTVDCAVDLGFYMTATIRFRLANIDAPELRGPGKEAGKASKKYLEELVAQHGSDVVIRTSKTEKYGRWLAEIQSGEKDLGSELVKSGHATSV
jgi:micrococcal nuclease